MHLLQNGLIVDRQRETVVWSPCQIPILDINSKFIIALYNPLQRIFKFTQYAHSEEKTLSKRDFEKVLFEAIDEGLSSLGESPKQAIYFHLDKNFNIEKHEIPAKIEAFADAINSIFGLGGSFLEIMIMQKIREKMGKDFGVDISKKVTLKEYVLAAKKNCGKREVAKNATMEWVICDQTSVEG